MNVARVATKGGTFLDTTKKALTHPTPTPIRRARTTAASRELSFPPLTCAAMIIDIPMTPPTERSMPAVRRTNVWPMATMPRIAACRSTLTRFVPE
jgi:hypothetical protein